MKLLQSPLSAGSTAASASVTLLYLSTAFFSNSLVSGLATSYGHPKSCRCQPHQSCWPSGAEWKSFNSSIGGILLSVRPLSAPCYEGTPEYNAAKCAAIKAGFQSSRFRGNQPGASQHVLWETFPPKNESCYLPATPLEFPRCDQGSVPLYSVPARNAKDISQAVRFAKKHNIPLSIKNTGHDFLGRSLGRNSLSIWTHFLKDIQFINGGWKPTKCGAKYAEPETVVKIAAGVQLYELYHAVSQKNRTVVAGFSNTVGAAGGYIQGGGHSPLGTWKGMASDNMLEAEVVTADGSIVTANECQNSDLFWALRGGGGGTYGVVTSVTLKTFDDPPAVLYSLNFTSPTITTNPANTTDEIYWKFVHMYESLLPKVADMGGSGYHWIMNNIPIGKGIYINQFISALFFVGSDYHNGTDISKLVKPIEEYAHSTGGTVANYTYVLPKTSILFDLLTGDDLDMGGNPVLGSRLLSRKSFESKQSVDKVINVFKELADYKLVGDTSVITCHNIAGGQVARNKGKIDSALNPAWREALNHVVVGTSWDAGTPFAEQDRLRRMVTEKLVPKLKTLDYDAKLKRLTMGAYINEADKEEPNWQESFWGYGKEGHYKKLKEIKDKWDPEGVFWCRPCVGSDEWDRYGVCRV